MKTASKKAKGRKLQNDVRLKLLETFPFLEEDDIRTAVMGESGEDIKLSPAAQKAIPLSFECKNQERLNLWDSLQQAEDNSNDRVPVLVFKRNRSKTYLTIEFEKFLEMIGENIDLQGKSISTRDGSNS